MLAVADTTWAHRGFAETGLRSRLARQEFVGSGHPLPVAALSRRPILLPKAGLHDKHAIGIGSLDDRSGFLG